MKGKTLTDIITRHTARKLPPDGIDLRAELAALSGARVRQALDQAAGDYGQAARLLRMSRHELLRLEARLADGEPNAAERRVGALDPHTIPRIAGGVEFISAAAIRRYAAEGHDEKAIASLLGCNLFLVEKVLRAQTAAEIMRLDREEKLTPKQIAERLRLPINRVRRVLVAHDLGALAHRASGGQDQ